MLNTVKLIGLTLMVSLFLIMPAQAEDEENDNIAERILITPTAGHGPELIKAITEFHHWVAGKEGHFEYTWYEILTGPDTGNYFARSGNHNWSDFDAEYDWQEEADHMFQANVAPHIESTQRSMEESLDEFSHWPEDFEGYTHFSVESWYVKGGQYGNFRKGLKKITDTLKAASYGSYFAFVSVESGGHGNQIILVSPKKGWSGMQGSDPSFLEIMIDTLGGEEEFNNFMSEWGGTFKVGQNQMVRYMPGASDYSNE
jgi:hypothetical protein